ncbi:MAG: hypothetical protein Q7N50_13710 [Armatimonadota bacterium]|nr:hypothetical protein [Armatimonadota bacterium]
MKHVSMVLILAILSVPGFASHNVQPQLGSWVATGTITDITGAAVSVLMKDGLTYKVNSANAQVVVRGRITNNLSLRVKDTAKVVGRKTGPTSIIADRIVVEPQTSLAAQTRPRPRVIMILGEAQPTAPAQEYKAPAQQPYIRPVAPKPPAPAITSTRRGLVSNVLYRNQSMTLQTSDGIYSVDLRPADIIEVGRIVGIGSLDPGDAVQIAGQLGDQRQIIAARVDILAQAQNMRYAPNVQRRTVVGRIVSIDYPSYTFKMEGAATPVLVLMDESTVIDDGKRTYTFTDLRPDARVRMVGYGSQSSGFVAKEVFIIGALY